MTQPQHKILYIDDERENLEGFTFIFCREYKIYTALNTKEADKILEKNHINIVIADQRMPEINGLEYINIIKNKYPDIVYIVLTAYADLNSLLEAVNMGGIFRYIIKPWNESEMRITINNALDRYHYIEENKKLLEDIKYKNEKLEKINLELKKTIEELNVAKEKAEESDRFKQSFIQNISHEIRTPMNGILGFTDLLKSSDLTEEMRLSFINIINKSGEQLMNIIENVLDMAKIEAGQVELHNQNIDINNLLNDIYSFHAPQIEKSGLNFILENPYCHESFIARTDGVKLRQIIENLVHNARKFTRQCEIKINVKKDKKETLFSVSDTGIGIEPQNTSIIFEPFHQLNSSLNQKKVGTGLGLSIIRSYAQLMGGKIWVESKFNKGSNFYVSLPLEIVSDENKRLYPEQKNKMIFENGGYILIVEDEDVNYYYLHVILKQMNLKTIRAANGIDAINICANEPEINLVLMDLKLPDLSGFDATKKIKAFRQNLPIIAQTSYALSSIKDKALTVGCNDFMTKPLLKKDLFQMLQKYLISKKE